MHDACTIAATHYGSSIRSLAPDDVRDVAVCGRAASNKLTDAGTDAPPAPSHSCASPPPIVHGPPRPRFQHQPTGMARHALSDSSGGAAAAVRRRAVRASTRAVAACRARISGSQSLIRPRLPSSSLLLSPGASRRLRRRTRRSCSPICRLSPGPAAACGARDRGLAPSTSVTPGPGACADDAERTVLNTSCGPAGAPAAHWRAPPGTRTVAAGGLRAAFGVRRPTPRAHLTQEASATRGGPGSRGAMQPARKRSNAGPPAHALPGLLNVEFRT